MVFLFALRLARLREKKGVSARDMSLSIGQNPGYINNIENGKALPSLSGIYYICDYLEVTPSEFFDLDTPDPNRLKEMTAKLKKLTPHQLELVLELVRELTEK